MKVIQEGGDYKEHKSKIVVGNNIIAISGFTDWSDDALGYIDKKYDEGWELVTYSSERVGDCQYKKK